VPFFPDVAWRDFAASTALVLAVLVLAIAVGPPALRIEANPTIVNTNPRPDWYFLSYFALLSLIPPEVENWVIVGVPIAIGVFLFAVPLVANRGQRHWSKRPWAVAAVGVGLLAGAVLTVAGDRAPWAPNIDAVQHGALPVSVTAGLDAQQSAGATLFVRRGCWACHTVRGTGGLAGPDLTFVGDRLSPDQLTTRILNGGRNMPAFASTLTPQEVDQLVAFLRRLKAKR
jgi:ubiquinol-cytochrome c reductase cytochrome b subunit